MTTEAGWGGACPGALVRGKAHVRGDLSTGERMFGHLLYMLIYISLFRGAENYFILF